MIPYRCHGPVGISRVEKIHQPVAIAVQARAGVWHVVDAERNKVFAGGIEIHPPVVLPVRTVRWLYSFEKSNVGDSVQIGCAAGSVTSRPVVYLRAMRNERDWINNGVIATVVRSVHVSDPCGQRRANVQSLSCDFSAVCYGRSSSHVRGIDQTEIGAGFFFKSAAVRSDSVEREEFRCIWPACECAVFGGFVKIATGSLLGVIAKGLIREKSKEAILENRPAGAAAPVVETTGVTHVRPVVAVVFGKGVQTRAMSFEVETAVVLIRAVLRNHLNLRAAVTSVFRVVVVRDDFHFLDGIFVRGNNGSAAPSNACRADAVDLIVVFSGARAVGSDLAAVFNLKHTIDSARAADGSGRQILRSASRALCAVSKSPWC